MSSRLIFLSLVYLTVSTSVEETPPGMFVKKFLGLKHPTFDMVVHLEFQFIQNGILQITRYFCNKVRIGLFCPHCLSRASPINFCFCFVA